MNDDQSHHDELVRKLTDPDATFTEDSTLEELRADLETLAGTIKEPIISDEIDRESELDRGLELARRIGRDLSHVSAKLQTTVEPELKRIRDYEIREKLGQGGMGAVYLAVHTKLNRAVALKILPKEKLVAGAVKRFEREMLAVAALSHPNIVAASDAGEANGTHYLVMELVNGYNLSSLIDRVGKLPIADACEIIRQAATGLAHAHRRSIIHRDIKPSNIMLARQDDGLPTIKLLDLGLALLDEQNTIGECNLTSAGQLVGTFDYMAPEQGADSHAVDARADVYALGATLFKLLTGEAPFDSRRYNSTFKLLTAKTTVAAPSVLERRTDIPAKLAEYLQQMLSLDPDSRPMSADEIAETLRPFASACDLQRLLDSADSSTPVLPSKALIDTMSVTASAPSIDTTGDLPTELCKPLPSETKRVGNTRNWVLPLFGLAMFGLISYGIIVKFQTKKGTVVIEAEGIEISEILLGTNSVKFTRQEDGKRYEFSADPTTAKLRIKSADGTVLETSLGTQELTIRPDSRSSIRTWLEPLNGSMPKSISDSDVPANLEKRPGSRITESVRDRQLFEWVTKRGGKFGWLSPTGVIRDVASMKGRGGRYELDFRGVTNFDDDDVRELRRLGTDLELRLNLAGTSITDETLRHLVGLRCLNLDLSNTAITDDGAPCLLGIDGLGDLDIVNTFLTPKSLEVIRKLPELQDLNLAGMGITDDDFDQLQGLDFYQLSIGQEQKLTDKSMEIIGEMTNLRTLQVPEGMSDEGIRSLNKLSNLETLVFGSSKGITDQSAIVIGSFKNLRYLHLPNTSITGLTLERLSNHALISRLGLNGNEGIAASDFKLLATFANLSDLLLDGTPVNDDSLRELAKLKHLSRLRLVSTNITDEGLTHLSGCKSLIYLNVQKTKVTAKGVSDLQKSLHECKIDSSFNEAAQRDIDLFEWVTKRGGKFGWLSPDGVIKDVASMKGRGGRFEIDFRGVVDFTDDDVSKLRSFGTDLELLLRFDGTSITDEALKHLVGMRCPYLDLSNTAITDEGATHLLGITGIAYLHVPNTKLTPESLEVIRKLPELHKLNIAAMGVSDNDFERLRGLDLYELRIMGEGKLTDESMVVVGEMTNMTSLDPGLTLGISDAGIRHLKKLTKLRGLILQSSKGITDQSAMVIGSFKNLQHLNLYNSSITGLTLENLDNRASLKRLILNGSDGISANDLKLLAAFTNLSDVELDRTQVNDDSLRELAKLEHLSRLRLVETNITDEGLAHLRACKSLTYLNVQKTKVTVQGVSDLQKSLPDCKIDSDRPDQK